MITVLLFAYLRETIGEEKLVFSVEGTVYDVKQAVMAAYPHLQLEGMITAVNEQFATDESIIQNGDTIAFIPPISGG